jgi:replication initiation and membrane attachment protein
MRMMELTLTVQDRLKLYTKTYLAPHHEQIIHLLYQPIIGHQAVGLYMTLWSLISIEKSELTLSHNQLLTFFDYDLNEFTRVRNKLEAIDLLNIYYHPSEGYYLYELRQPLTSKQFFLDSNLNVHLLYQVGYNLYEYLESKFVIRNIQNPLTNITKSFDEVYPEIEQVRQIEMEKDYVVNTVSQFNIPIHYDFDFELFTVLLNKSFISIDQINENREAIIKEAALYQFDAQMMSRVLLDCVNPKGLIDFDKLHETASLYYKRLKTKPTQQEIKATMSESEFHQQIQNLDELRKQALFNYKTKTPHEWLRILQNNTEVPNSYLEVVRFLVDDYRLNSEVINVLIEFVRKRNDGRLPREYTKTIASSWVFKKIKTAEEAMEEIDKIVAVETTYTEKGEVPPTYTRKKTRKAHVTSEPKWFEKHEAYRKNAKEETEEVDVTELEKLLASFK